MSGLDYEHEIYVDVITNDGRKVRALLQVSEPELRGLEKSPQSPTTTDLLTKRFEDTFPHMSVAENRISYRCPADMPST